MTKNLILLTTNSTCLISRGQLCRFTERHDFAHYSVGSGDWCRNDALP